MNNDTSRVTVVEDVKCVGCDRIGRAITGGAEALCEFCLTSGMLKLETGLKDLVLALVKSRSDVRFRERLQTVLKEVQHFGVVQPEDLKTKQPD